MGSRGRGHVRHALFLAAHGRPGHDVRRGSAMRAGVVRSGVVQMRGSVMGVRSGGVKVRGREERLAAVG